MVVNNSKAVSVVRVYRELIKKGNSINYQNKMLVT